MGKSVQLTPRQLELVDMLVGYLRYCEEKYSDFDEEGLGAFGPPEAFYHPPKDWTKLP
ncbi:MULTISPECIES: hypothetical protein [Rahnella]|uniref:Uncharacterized protein n=1 Tax=Rahnella laticis TaxID=2787622 RepID=A0ABS0EGR8_9GAMM|nr:MULTISPECIES: hypothetical protein [Rahnella]MBF7982499.1 hypothetical protein [Rahnella laticis]MBF8002495.1 hypothetical protein [Rahnella sp. LAC-M12]